MEELRSSIFPHQFKILQTSRKNLQIQKDFTVKNLQKNPLEHYLAEEKLPAKIASYAVDGFSPSRHSASWTLASLQSGRRYQQDRP